MDYELENPQQELDLTNIDTSNLYGGRALNM
jgi:hypothetical protein